MLLEAFIVVMAFALSGDPVEDEVGGGDEDEFSGVGVEGIFAGPEGFFPYAAFAAGDAFAVAEGFAGDVGAHGAVIADDDADVADGDDGFGDDFDGGEPAVDEIGAVGEGDVLPAAAAAGAEEGFGVLEVVVIVWIGAVVADGGGDDFAGGEARAVVDGDDADAVDGHGFAGRELVFGGDGRADDDGIESADVVEFFLPADDGGQFLAAVSCRGDRRVFGDDDEEGEVDGVNAFAKDDALAAALADGGLRATSNRRGISGVLEIVAVDDAAEGLAGGQGSPSRA